MTLIFKVNRHVNNYAIVNLGKPYGKMLINVVDDKQLFKINESTKIEKLDDNTFQLRSAEIETSEFRSMNIRFDIDNTSSLAIDENTVLNSEANIFIGQHSNIIILNSVIFTNLHKIHFRSFCKIINSTIFETRHTTLANVEFVDKCLFVHPSIPKPLQYPKTPYVPSLRETLIVLLTNDYTSAVKSKNYPKTIILKNEDCNEDCSKNICIKNVKKFYQVYDEVGCICYMMFVGIGDMQVYRFSENATSNATSDSIRQNELRELRKQYSPSQHFNPNFIVNYTDDILFKLKHLKEHPNATNEELDEILKDEPIKIINVQKRSKLFINDGILSKTPYCVNIDENRIMSLYQYHDFTSIFDGTGAYNYIPNLLMKCVLDINCTQYESLGYDIDIDNYLTLFKIINKPQTNKDDWLRTIGID